MLLVAAAVFLQIAFTHEEQSTGFFVLGEWAGSAIGTILGGYAGLKWAGSKINLVDRVTPTDSYSVNMVKFIGVGEGIDRAIVKASAPYVAPLWNMPRHIIKAVCQTAGYNSQFLVPVLRKSFRDRKLVPTLPLALKMLCNRYCIDNSFQIATKITNLSSLKILPTILKKGLSLLKSAALIPQIQSSVEFLGSHADVIANITMRSFHEYMKVLKRVDPKDLKASLKKEIPGAATVSPVFDLAMKETVTGWADSLIENVREMEIELTGYELQTENERAALKFTLTVYLKYYVIFTLLNCNRFTTELSPMEERDFFTDLNDAFFSIYTHETRPNRLAQGLKKVTAFAIDSIHKVQRFIEQAEHNSGVIKQAVVVENFHPDPAPPLFADAVEVNELPF
jgi:hypothetical protein